MTDRAARINALLGSIDLPEFYRLLDERLKGGLPGQSMGDGIRAGGRPLPKFDPVDEILLRTKREVSVAYFLIERYRKSKNWSGVERELSKVHNLVQSVTAVYEEKPTPDSVPCANTACVPIPETPERGYLTDRDLEEGRTSGECSRCRVHRSRYGLAFPNKAVPGEMPAQENEVA